MNEHRKRSVHTGHPWVEMKKRAFCLWHCGTLDQALSAFRSVLPWIPLLTMGCFLYQLRVYCFQTVRVVQCHGILWKCTSHQGKGHAVRGHVENAWKSRFVCALTLQLDDCLPACESAMVGRCRPMRSMCDVMHLLGWQAEFEVLTQEMRWYIKVRLVSRGIVSLGNTYICGGVNAAVDVGPFLATNDNTCTLQVSQFSYGFPYWSVFLTERRVHWD